MIAQSMQASDIQDDIAKIRRDFLAAKENFVRIPDALKGIPKMNPLGFCLFLFLLFEIVSIFLLINAVRNLGS